MEMNRKDIFRMLFVFMALLLGGGCFGGNSSTEPTNPPPPAQKTISFTPSGSPLNNSVYMEQVSIKNDEITLALKIKGGIDVVAHAIEINFDGGKIQYLSGSAGSYLKQDGKATSGFNDNILTIGTSGVLTLGDSRQSAMGIVTGVNGDGILCQIILKVLADQTNTSVSFNTTNSFIYNSSKASVGNNWISGSLSYQ